MSDTPKPTLFLSHATEDKAAFVTPLEKELQKRRYPTWYDLNDLPQKESLLSEINKGLLKSDFGITVFSKYYFQKKWTLGELDGLYALETATKKIIIPIRYQMSFEELKREQPILAGRRIIDGNLPIEQVADEIELAIDYIARAKQLSPLEAMRAKLKRVVDVKAGDSLNARLMGDTAGTKLILKELKSAFDAVELAVKEFAETQSGWKVAEALVGAGGQPRLSVECPFQVWGQISMVGLAINAAHLAKLFIDVRRLNYDNFGQFISADSLKKQEFSPYFDSEDSVTWFNGNTTIPNERLAEHFLEELVSQVSARGLMGRRPK